MDILLILWMIAGFFIGFIVIDLIARLCSRRAPVIWNLAVGAVGVLTAYTIITGVC